MAAGDVAGRIGAKQPRAQRGGDVGMRRAIVGVQVALDDGVGDRRHAALLDRGDARRPGRPRRLRVARHGVGEDGAAQQLGVADREPLADHAAHRQADPRDRPAAPFADQARRIVDEVVHRVRPGGRAEPPWPRWS